MNTRYPAAERFASTVRLPLTVCPVTRELYGYALPVLDVAAARHIIFAANHRGAAASTALAILHERVAALGA